jgi:ABC-2 type transport system permease protein
VGVWFTLVLVNWLGARRARTWAQVIAALLGATAYIGFQIHNALPPDLRGAMATFTSRLFASPAFTIVARAGRGEWLPLLTLAALATTTALITTRLLNRIFVTGIQEAGVGRVRRQRRRPYHFVDGLIRATFRKDLRLIVRDPLLLSRVLPSVFYLVPVLFPLHRIGNVGAPGLLGPFAVIASVTLSSQLTAVAAAGEEGWDLIRLSPASTVTLRLAKIAAGMALPGAVTVVLVIAIAWLGRPGLAALTLTTALASAAGSCWVEVASMRPTPRKDLIQRSAGARRPFSVRRVFAALAFLGVGTTAVVLAAHELWWFSGAAFAVVAIAVIACFTLIEMQDIEFEAAPVRRNPHDSGEV